MTQYSEVRILTASVRNEDHLKEAAGLHFSLSSFEAGMRFVIRSLGEGRFEVIPTDAVPHPPAWAVGAEIAESLTSASELSDPFTFIEYALLHGAQPADVAGRMMEHLFTTPMGRALIEATFETVVSFDPPLPSGGAV